MKTAHALSALAAGAALAISLAGCGSSTTSSSDTSSSTAVQRTTTTAPVATRTVTHTTSASPDTGATSSTSVAATTTAPVVATSTSTTSTTQTQTTRTQTAPAFVHPPHAGGELAAAVAVLARRGYSAIGERSYVSGDTLRVLIGAKDGATPPAEHAFFFLQGTYLGTDASAPSRSITVLARSDSEITLGYGLFGAGSTPGSVARVRFALDMGRLATLDPLPSAAARN